MNEGSKRARTLRLLLIRGDRRIPVVEQLLSAGELRIELEQTSRPDTGFPRAVQALFDAVLLHLDGKQPFVVGIIERLHRDLAAPIIVLSATWNDVWSTQAIHYGAQDFIAIDQTNARSLIRSVQLAIERQRVQEELRRENEQLRTAKHELEKLIITDPLTSVLNQRGFERAMEDEPRLAQGRPSSSILVDCDDLRLINQRHGRAAGDEVLREIAKRIGGCLRKSDSISRIGGDEFVLLLPNASEEDALAIAERARSVVRRRPISTSAGPLEVSVSVRLRPLPCAEQRPPA